MNYAHFGKVSGLFLLLNGVHHNSFLNTFVTGQPLANVVRRSNRLDRCQC